MTVKTGRVGGKVALVTGGASGIGAASSLALAREGAVVVLTDLADAAGHEIAAEISAHGGTALFLHHDVASETGWEAVVAETVARFGRIDVAVNNAGISGGTFNLMTSTLEDWRHVLSVNLDAVFLGLRHFGPVMAQNGGGSIINMASIMGKVGMANSAAYCASKGGLTLLTKAAALEWAGLKIRVNSVHPGYIDTPLLSTAMERRGKNNAMRDMLISRHPIGRFGLASEIADAVVFLASEESSFMTGSELVVDGGYTAA